MADKKEEEFSVSSKDFVKSMFNTSFNEFIGKYHNKKNIGKDDKTPEYSYGKHYSTADGLVEIYTNLNEKENLNKADVVQTVKTLAKLYVESNKFEEFKEAIDSYLEILKSDYKLDISLVFDMELDKLSTKKPDDKKSSEPKKESVAEKKDPVFEETPYEPEPMLDPEPRRHPRSTNPKSIIFGILLAIVLVVVLFKIVEYKGVEIPAQIVQETVQPELTPVKFTFEDYFRNSNYYDNTNMTLTGFLRYELRPVGRTSFSDDYYVVDDYGNKILLSFAYIKNSHYYEPLFTKDTTTRDLFNVTGTFKKDSVYTVRLYVQSITSTKREYTTQ